MINIINKTLAPKEFIKRLNMKNNLIIAVVNQLRFFYCS